MYTETDINRMITTARNNRETVLAEIDRQVSGPDNNVLQAIVKCNDFFAENFDRHDSDVCKQFIAIMETLHMA